MSRAYNFCAGPAAVSRQKIWDTTSKKLRETFIHYSLGLQQKLWVNSGSGKSPKV